MDNKRTIAGAILALVVATPVLAQQPPAAPAEDTKLLQAAIQSLQAQRNRALDEAAGAEAQFAKAQQEIVDLKKQLDAAKAKK